MSQVSLLAMNSFFASVIPAAQAAFRTFRSGRSWSALGSGQPSGFQGAGFRVWIVGFSLGQHIPLRSQLGSLLFVPSEAGKLFNAEPLLLTTSGANPGFQ